MSEKIPSPLIGVIAEVFDDYYTHSDIERLFAYADAPGDAPPGNKVKKTVDWLRYVNKQAAEPLKIVGQLLEEILEKDPLSQDEISLLYREPDWSVKLRNCQAKIRTSLEKAGLIYSRGGRISAESGTSTISLRDLVEKEGLVAVDIEMTRALAQVDADPNAAAHYAGNVLEATLKAYLIKKAVSFDDQSDTLNRLWELVRDALGINSKDMTSKDLKKIASGLNSIVDGTMYLRNKRSGAHGRTDGQLEEISLRPRHARLVIHSAHTLAAYVLECLAGEKR